MQLGRNILGHIYATKTGGKRQKVRGHGTRLAGRQAG